MTTVFNDAESVILLREDGTFDSRDPEGTGQLFGPRRIRITGTDFGNGPTVVFFDRVKQDAGDDFDLNSPQVGEYSEIELGDLQTTHKYVAHDGRSWIPLRDPDNVAENSDKYKPRIWLTPGEDFSEFMVAYRLCADPTRIFPRASAPQGTVFPGTGNYKPFWLTDDANSADLPDVVVGTFDANGVWMNGNSCTPRGYEGESGFGLYFANGDSKYFDTSGASTLIGYYQSGEESTEGAHDAEMSLLRVDSAGGVLINVQGDPFNINSAPEGLAKRSYDDILINGQVGNLETTWSNIQSLMNDIYVSIGPNARACVILSDAAVLGDSTQAYIVPPDEWTGTAIECDTEQWERLGYAHVITADGTLMEDVGYEIVED